MPRATPPQVVRAARQPPVSTVEARLTAEREGWQQEPEDLAARLPDRVVAARVAWLATLAPAAHQ